MANNFDHLLVCIASQSLRAWRKDREVRRYRVSTASRGPGQQLGSECTPLGKHTVRAKVGAGAALNSVFVGRRASGEVWNAELDAAYPGRDWILTRILWLRGEQTGYNRRGDVDTLRRYIYIHGTPDLTSLGQPASHGCIRMASDDIVELFDQVAVHTPCQIVMDADA